MARNVVVTGGGTGIGRAVAASFAADGDTVVILGRRPEPLKSTATELGPAVRAVVCDATDPTQVEALRAQLPTTVDDSLAPPGMHIASLFCQQFDPKLDWDLHREAVANLIVETVTDHAPNFKASIVARQIHSPLDLERKFGLIGGDIMHGNMGLDQLWAARPVLGHGDYRGPIKGLYMCGAGTHPGGGVTGAPGHNAAAAILADRPLLRKILRS